MENRQTAVEWLEQKVFEEFKVPINYQVYEQAKQMEKEQIMDAYDHISMMTAEQYYNETFET